MLAAKKIPGLPVVHPGPVDGVQPADVVHPGDDVGAMPAGQRPQRRGQRQVEVERQRVVDDQHVELGHLGGKSWDDLGMERGEIRGDLAAVEGITYGAHRGLTGVQLRDDCELRRVWIRQWAATSAQDGDGITPLRKSDRLLVEDRFDTADDGRAGVVQEPDARPSAQTVSYVMTGGSSRMTARSSGFSRTSTCGRPPL